MQESDANLLLRFLMDMVSESQMSGGQRSHESAAMEIQHHLLSRLIRTTNPQQLAVRAVIERGNRGLDARAAGPSGVVVARWWTAELKLLDAGVGKNAAISRGDDLDLSRRIRGSGRPNVQREGLLPFPSAWRKRGYALATVVAGGRHHHRHCQRASKK